MAVMDRFSELRSPPRGGTSASIDSLLDSVRENRSRSKPLLVLRHPSDSSLGVEAGSRESVKRTHGVVKWFNNQKGYGFITKADGRDVFVHFTEVVDWKTLQPGESVEFEVVQRGRSLQAGKVVRSPERDMPLGKVLQFRRNSTQ